MKLAETGTVKRGFSISHFALAPGRRAADGCSPVATARWMLRIWLLCFQLHSADRNAVWLAASWRCLLSEREAIA